ncbi:MAG: hypothetical protein CM15mV18_1140 [uncultured marine virus]|nr:MAG: hypothetical protein CM15mV18_1140 [uncultured marine virus]
MIRFDHPDLPEVSSYKRVRYFNNIREPRETLKEDAAFLSEVAPTNATNHLYKIVILF